MKAQYGLIGYPLGHSFSRSFFTKKFQEEKIDAEYLNFEIPEVSTLLRIIQEHPHLKGVNVTLPHKVAVIPLLHELSPEAAAIGAVNVIRITHTPTGGTYLKGFNSDVIGFTDSIRPLLKSYHRKALFSNQTGCLSDGRHVLDILVEGGIQVTTLFSPEHGFRGTADAGEHVQSQTDSRTGIPILSLYDGQKPGPSDEAMRRFDLLVVDIQDVGLRFYTYYITMLQLMRRCSEFNREVIILDRPNPNGHFVDGPLLDMSLKSGVGALPIPIVHGMTLGELATMAIGEGWVPHCRLTVVPCLHYTHQSAYHLPIPPSPNLPDMRAVLLYPSICYFEGTVLSLGRGTDHPFQCYGHPLLQGCTFSFTPSARPGAKHPPLEGQ